jgi:DNA-binding MarR family transcriptional regulator
MYPHPLSRNDRIIFYRAVRNAASQPTGIAALHLRIRRWGDTVRPYLALTTLIMTKPRSCPALQLDNQLCFALHSTSLLMTKVYKPMLQRIGLTYPQYLAMLVLWEDDGITVGDISARLLTDPGSLTPLLKRLEAEGFITRTRRTEDERVVELRLTEKGRSLQIEAECFPTNILSASGQTPESIAALKKQIIALRSALQKLV